MQVRRKGFINKSGHPLWDVEETLKANKGHSTLTHASLMKVFSQIRELKNLGGR